MKAPNGRHSGDGSHQARRHGGAFGAVTPNLFCALPSFVVLRKICFKHMIKTKIVRLQMYFAPQTLKPGYGPGSAKIVPEIRIFCFQGHSVPKCSVTVP